VSQKELNTFLIEGGDAEADLLLTTLNCNVERDLDLVWVPWYEHQIQGHLVLATRYAVRIPIEDAVRVCVMKIGHSFGKQKKENA
jgi:hypothetical protein